MDIYKPICEPPVKNVLGGTEDYFQSSQGKLFFTQEGTGSPLILVHGFNRGASSFEFRKNFSFFTQYYQVFALDLPGFGKSEKKQKTYLPFDYITALREFCCHVVKRPASMIARSLPAAYCLHLAYYYPALVRQLVAILPAGVTYNYEPAGEVSKQFADVIVPPIQGDAVYNVFVSKESTRYFLRTYLYANPQNVTDELVDHLYQAAHQCPNAKYAPASFLAGYLNLDIRSIYPCIAIPHLIIYGSKPGFSTKQESINIFLSQNSYAKGYVIANAGLAVQEEQPEEFNQVVLQFLKRI